MTTDAPPINTPTQRTYRIRDWDQHFETAQSRKVRGPLTWVSLPTAHDGRKYRRLMRLHNGAAVYAGWCLMLQVAAKCPTRGTLVASDGPLTADDLSLMTDAPAQIFVDALAVLSDPQAGIGWIEVVQMDAPAANNGSTVVARSHDDTSTDYRMTSTDKADKADKAQTRQTEISASADSAASKSEKSSKEKSSSVFSWLKPEDLRDVPKLIDWQKRAAKCPNPVCDATEADRLNIVAAAVHCWDHADDPIKLFAWIVGKKQWHSLREIDEDTAAELIKDYLRGGSKPKRREHSDCKSAADAMPDLLSGLGVTP